MLTSAELTDRWRYHLTLHGPFPTKKNRLRPRGKGRGGRGQMYDPEVSAFKQRLAMEARGDWGCREPLVHPDVVVTFFVANYAKDRDGIWTTVLDALKEARVIFDDSIRWFNGTETHKPGVIVAGARLERVAISFEVRKENSDAK